MMDNVASPAHVWAPIWATIGPALLKEAENVIAYSEDIVAGWLGRYMFREEEDPSSEGKRVARQFNEAGTMNDHGHRIGRDEAQGWGVKAHALESDQALQEAVLTAYPVRTCRRHQTDHVVRQHLDEELRNGRAADGAPAAAPGPPGCSCPAGPDLTAGQEAAPEFRSWVLSARWSP